MTKRQYNALIKELYVNYLAYMERGEFNEESENLLKKELSRLWYKDEARTVVTLKTFKMLLVVNQTLRSIPLHSLCGHKMEIG